MDKRHLAEIVLTKITKNGFLHQTAELDGSVKEHESDSKAMDFSTEGRFVFYGLMPSVLGQSKLLLSLVLDKIHRSTLCNCLRICSNELI